MSATAASSNGHHESGSIPPPEAPPAPVSVYDRLMALVPEANDELGKVEERAAQMRLRHSSEIDALRQRHKDALELLRDEERKIRELLKLAGHAPPPKQQKAKTVRGKQAPAGLSIGIPLKETLLALQTFNTEDRFSAPDIAAVHGRVEYNKYYQPLNWLKEQQIIMRAGDQTRADGLGAARKMYRLMEPEMVTKLLNDLFENPVPAAPAAPASQAYSDYTPTKEQVLRFHDAITAFEEPEFAVTDINAALGLKSPKQSYRMFAYLTRIGFLVAGRKEQRGGSVGTQLYTVADPEAINRSYEEAVSA